MSLFDGGGADDAGPPGFDERAPIPATEFDKATRLAFEKEMLGLYVSDHPLMGAERSLRRHADCTLAELKELREGELRTVGGVVTGLSRRYTKRGDLMATFVLEDLGAALEVLVFPKVMAACDPLLTDDAIVCVKGRLDLRDETPRVVAVEVTAPKLVFEEGAPVRLKVKASALTEARVTRLQALLREHPGDRPVFVHLQGEEKTTILRLSDDHLVDDSNGLYGELRELLGRDCLA